MKRKLNVVIVHGTGGSPQGNWFPWLAKELAQEGHATQVPKLPTPEGQDLTAWTREFKKQIGPLTSDMTLIGHSLGVGFILNLLENSNMPVRATFFISGFLGKLGLEEFDTLNNTFLCRDFEWSSIKRNAGKITIINSDNDPYVPIEKGEELSKKLGVPLIVLHAAGHINADSGYTTYPDLLLRVLSLSEDSKSSSN